MKKTLTTTILAILLCVCMVFGFAGCANQEDIDNSVNTAIAPISEQITAINTSIDDLETVDTTLDGYIDALETKVTELEASDTATAEEITAIKSVIETLKTKDTELEGKITTLENYVNTELSTTEDWAEATFATLAQYAEIQTDITGIKATLTTLVDTTALSTAISTSEDNMKKWVNETLADGYYTITEIDTKLSDLKSELNGKDDTLNAAINAQKTALEKAKTDLTTAYNNAISTAINDNNGTIDQKIANDITAAKTELQEKIDAIKGEITQIKADITALNTTVGELQGKIDELEQENTDLKNQIEEMIALNCLNEIHAWKVGVCEHCETCYYEITDTTATIDFPIHITQEEFTAVTQLIFTNTITNITISRDLTAEELTVFESYIKENVVYTIGDVEYHAVFDETALRSAVKLTNNHTIKIMDSFSIVSTHITSTGKYTLDLNGKALDFTDNIFEIRDGSVIIKDTGSNGSMTTTNADNGGVITVFVEQVNLTIESGTFNGNKYAVLSVGNNLTVKGGTFTVSNSEGYCIGAATKKNTIMGNPVFSGGKAQVYFAGNQTLDLTNAEESLTIYCYNIEGATITLNSDWTLYDSNNNVVTGTSNDDGTVSYTGLTSGAIYTATPPETTVS